MNTDAAPRFYVSLAGRDTWSGTLPEPDARSSDGPFATLERARDALRVTLQAARPGKGKGEPTVVIRAGAWELSRSLRLGPEDSGREGQAVVWRAHPGERPAILGSRSCPGARLAKDPRILERLPPQARGRVFELDLRAQGIIDSGTVTQRGNPGMELFVAGARMELSRWPAEGWLQIADVPQQGERMLHPGLEREKRYDGVPIGRHYGTIRYDGDRPASWRDHAGILLHGYWTWDWNDSFQTVERIDTATRTIVMAEPHHSYGYTKKQRFAFLNILEELSRPGSWCIDRARGMLWFWPPEGSGGEAVRLSMLEDPLVTLEGCRHVRIQGLRLAESRGNGICIRGGSDNLVAGCLLTHLGDDAVKVSGERNGVQSCDILNVSSGGIMLEGGDKTTLAPGGNFARNNHIHLFSRWVRTYKHAIAVEGVGQHVAHNVMHEAPQEAMFFRGNDHLIEFNEIYDICRETGDVGAIHTGRNWTWRGNVLRHNYIHDILGPGLHGSMGIYLDDFMCGTTIYGNVFARAGRAAFIGGGRDNTIENNVFVECAPSVHVDARGMSWAAYYFDGTYPALFTSLEEVHGREPPYVDRYPELRTILDGNPAIPEGNRVLRNVSWGGRWLDLHDRVTLRLLTIQGNVISDPDLGSQLVPEFTGPDDYYLNVDSRAHRKSFRFGDPWLTAELERTGNVLQAGPGLEVDFERRTIRVPEDSPARRLGFKDIPFREIGLVVDEYRTRV